MAISRWDPFREMLVLRRAMDRMVDEDWAEQNSFSWNLPLDVIENEEGYVVKASLPGVNPDELEITYSNNTLSIRGEVHAEEERKGERYHLRERRYGSFARSISLPTHIDANQIEANYDAGVLTLRLPKAEEVKPRRISIQNGRQTVEG